MDINDQSKWSGISKLLGKETYDVWKFQVKTILEATGKWNVASGKEEYPVEGTAGAIRNWNRLDAEARRVIVTSISDSCVTNITECKTAKSMIDILDTLYGSKSPMSLHVLQTQFHSFKYNERESVAENITKIRKLSQQMESFNEKISESMLITRILMMLPGRFSHFHSAWDSVTTTEKNVANLLARLIVEEERIKFKEGNNCSSSDMALATRWNKSGHNSRSSVTCYRCGQRGHIVKDCRVKLKSFAKEDVNQVRRNFMKPTDRFACHICSKFGHFAKECPEKKENEKKFQPKPNSIRRQDGKNALIIVNLSTKELSEVDEEVLKNAWLQDCGATEHMCPRLEWFVEYEELEEPVNIRIGDGTEMKGIGVGDIEVQAFDGKEWIETVLCNVLYVPNLNFNLFSVMTVLEKGIEQHANAMESIFLRNGKICAIGERFEKMFKMKFRRTKEDECALECKENDFDLGLVTFSTRPESLIKWHERMGHQNVRYVRDKLKSKNVNFIEDWDDYVCEGCMYGKLHRLPFSLSESRAKEIGELVHVDLCGPMSVESLGGSKYFLQFKDDKSNYKTIYFLKYKNEVFLKLKEYLKLVENQFGQKVKVLRSDNGTEIENKDIRELLKGEGIIHQLSVPFTPEQNGRVEREFRTIVEMARTILHSKNLSRKLWAEAVNYAVFTLNLVGKSHEENRSPYEIWFDREVKLNSIKIFGSTCYIHIPKVKRTKLDSKSKKGIFVGYCSETKGFRVYIPEDQSIEISRDAVFDEKTGFEHEVADFYVENDNTNNGNNKEIDNVTAEEEPNSENEIESKNDPATSNRYSLRNRSSLKPPQWLREYELSLIMDCENISTKKALEDENWRRAMDEEIKSLEENNTWVLVEKPENVKPITCKWVLRVKEDGRFKARLVARGFEQKEGIDYTETFSPVTRYESIRMMLSYASLEKLEIMTFDVRTAFLHGELDEKLFMVQPDGYEDGSGRVCQLIKSLYGLKQAPKKWNEKFTNFLKQLNFKASDADLCVFYQNSPSKIIIALFVDDGLVVGSRLCDMNDVLKKLNAKFKIKVNSPKNSEICYLGMKIRNDEDGKIFINQAEYTKKILKRFAMEEANGCSIPMDVREEWQDDNTTKNVPYREAIGSLLYLATVSRPDIAFPTNFLSRYMENPKQCHWNGIKKILRYLRKTTNFGILYDGNGEIIAYSDADFAGDLNDRKSTSGFVFMNAGGAVAWNTRKQSTVALSTAEAEYVSACEATKDVIWLRNLAIEIGMCNENPTKLLVDNKSAIHIIEGEGKFARRTKHIDVKYKFICENLGKTIYVNYVSSEEQLSDIFTKPLAKHRFEMLRKKLGVIFLF